MQMRTVAAALNGSLVLALYIVAWGAPSAAIAGLEAVLATGAAISTWYALKNLRTPLCARLILDRIVQGYASA
jgi:hypothetical protein